MHGLYINPDDSIVKFVKDLCKFTTKIKYDDLESKPYSKYVKMGYDKSICYTFTIDDIKKVLPGFKKLSFLRDDPEFKFRVAFTDNPNASNALHCYKDNRITIIIKTNYEDKNADVDKRFKEDKKTLGTLTHELTHSFDYSKTPKSTLDKNKDDVYHMAKKELSLGKDYTTFKKDVDDVIKDASEIYKFYYVCLYYTQQTEMNAYLRTFQNEAKENDSKIQDVETYRRFKWMKTFLSKYEDFAKKDVIIEKLKNSSFPSCYGKVNKILNNPDLDDNDKLRKINFIISHNYIEYEMRRMVKIYNDIKEGNMNEHYILSFEDFTKMNSDEVECD